jgi:nicotinamide/nicotinate riboside kinase
MAALQPQLDIRLFLRTSEEQAKKRRAKRAGYATLEGFWEDPPGYVENIVWPNYVRDHAFLFKDGDVEGEVDEAVMREHGIECLGKGDVDMATTVEWAVNVLMRRLPEVIGERGQGK